MVYTTVFQRFQGYHGADDENDHHPSKTHTLHIEQLASMPIRKIRKRELIFITYYKIRHLVNCLSLLKVIATYKAILVANSLKTSDSFTCIGLCKLIALSCNYLAYYIIMVI